MLIDWIEKQYKQGAEIASICTGAFLLASSGLLDGKACSTHWSVADHFRAMFPKVNLQTDKLITDENGIYTSGGAYSFLNLLIYLVEKYYDRQTAIFFVPRYFRLKWIGKASHHLLYLKVRSCMGMKCEKSASLY